MDGDFCVRTVRTVQLIDFWRPAADGRGAPFLRICVRSRHNRPRLPSPISLPPRSLDALADGADGVDGRGTPLSGRLVIWMVRVRARPARSNSISMPTWRRNVAARRSRPDRARGVAGQVLALVSLSPTSSSRAPRSSEAVPVHTVRTVRQFV